MKRNSDDSTVIKHRMYLVKCTDYFLPAVVFFFFNLSDHQESHLGSFLKHRFPGSPRDSLLYLQRGLESLYLVTNISDESYDYAN